MSYSERLVDTAEFEPPINTRVAILDAGSQLTKSIDRKIRGLSIQSDVFPIDTPLEKIKEYPAYVISGGPESVYTEGAPKPDPRIFDEDKPILGICYGMQLMNMHFGGDVKNSGGSYGQARINIDQNNKLFLGLDEAQKVLLTHGDSITELAPGFREVARANGIIAAIADDDRKNYGVQFHPEDHQTENGIDILSNFLFKVAELEPNYTVEDRLEKGIKEIKEKVGDRQVLAFVSGGVDSTVLAAMLALALPAEQVHAVHVDTGFMRKDESNLVKQSLKDAGIELDVINAENQFQNARTIHNGELTPPLCEVTDPEVKRHIIGDMFMHIREQYIISLNIDPQNSVLAQGTLRPDLIESASNTVSSNAQTIKTHHNDTKLVQELRAVGGVIEPLSAYHKDEVRELGNQLGLPDELIWRQPFPGPGLAVRLICAKEAFITNEFEKIRQQLKNFEDPDIAAHLLPFRTVGVQGDGRTFSYAAALSGKPDWPRLIEKAKLMPTSIKEVNRVVYIFGDKLVESPMDITPTFPEPDAIGQLRQADAIVNEVLHNYGLDRKISQVPVVSFPVNFGNPGERSIGIRTIITPDYYTGIPAIPGEHIPHEAIDEIIWLLLSLPGVARVAYDLTAKPPATIEWE
jgi:GMP synthase (glutamine-hydrolysing)